MQSKVQFVRLRHPVQQRGSVILIVFGPPWSSLAQEKTCEDILEIQNLNTGFILAYFGAVFNQHHCYNKCSFSFELALLLLCFIF